MCMKCYKFKGALCHGQNNVPKENVCYCFDELTGQDVSFISPLLAA